MKGSAFHANDHDRSAPEDLFFEKLRTPNWDWVSLQYGAFGFKPKDYAETARVIAGLDAVVSVDTSVAHLAGTLGVPTFTLLQTAPEWRWGLPPHDKTPWYESMTLVRRKDWKDWAGAIEKVSELLTDLQRREAA